MEFNEKNKVLTAGILLLTFTAYSLYLYSSLPRQNLAKADDSNGKLVWQQKNCISCHQIYGLGGYLGPDLTNVYSAKGPEYIKAFLKTGTVVMPNFKLSEKEIQELMNYLKNIDQTGKADPRTFTISYNGTIKQ